MAAISFEGVTKVFDDGTCAVDDLSLHIPDGAFAVLVGPSGSGKSTALRMVAGLEDATGGTIRIGDRVVNDVRPRDRDIAMVFQSYALYPHMSVERNLGFALRMQGMEKPSVRDRVAGVAAKLGMGDLLARRPGALSGGQRQRVALGRAIVREPQAFLMDEPLSNLDAQLRVDMRAYIARLQQELGTTTLYVTHDQTEAMTMGDRVAVMRDGRLEQVAPPQELYDHPANTFVATFIGSPAMNLLPGRVERDGDGVTAAIGDQRLPLGDIGCPPGEDMLIGVRPEAFTLAPDDAPGLTVTVEFVEALGSDLVVHGTLAAGERRALNGAPGPARVIARLEPSLRTAPGQTLRLAVERAGLHCFEPVTGLRTAG